MSKFDFRDREATIAAVVGRVHSDADIEIRSDDYPTPLPSELRHLLKFWIRVALDIEYYRFLTGNLDACDADCIRLAWARVDAIRKVLGAEAVDDALEEVRDELGQYEDPRYWNIFWDGTLTEQEAAQKEIRHQEYGHGDGKVA